MKIGHAKILSTFPDHTPEWHAARKGGIGGSESAIVLGHNPYGKTRLDLWSEKTGRTESTFRGNVATAYGTLLEPYIFERLAFDHGYMVRECDHQLTHPDHEWMRCNVDGLIMDDQTPIGIIEIKTSSTPLKNDMPHEYHMPQIQHNLAVTGLPFCIYAYHTVPVDRLHALSIADRFVADDMIKAYWQYIAQCGQLQILRIERDDKYIDGLIEHEMQFWSCVDMDIEPPEIAAEGEEIVDDDDLSELMNAYALVLQQITNAKPPKELDTSKDALLAAIKLRCDVIARKGGTKRITLQSGGSIIWNARGYWQAKPVAPKQLETEIELPF